MANSNTMNIANTMNMMNMTGKMTRLTSLSYPNCFLISAILVAFAALSSGSWQLHLWQVTDLITLQEDLGLDGFLSGGLKKLIPCSRHKFSIVLACPCISSAFQHATQQAFKEMC